MEFLSVIALIASGVAVVVALGCLQSARQTSPAQLSRNLGQLAELVKEYGEKDEGRDSRMIGWRAEIEAVLEQVENLCEVVERKRRSIASSASKLGNGVDPPVDDRAAHEQAFRAMGLEV